MIIMKILTNTYQIGLVVIVVVVACSSLLKVGDHGSTHKFSKFSPILFVSCHRRALRRSLAGPVCYIVAPSSSCPHLLLCHSVDLHKCVFFCSDHVAEVLQLPLTMTVATNSLSAPISFNTGSLVLRSLQLIRSTRL